jgi:hypothetical protein
MHSDIWPLINSRIMEFGYTLHEAEYISNRLFAGSLLIVTLREYTISGEGYPDRPGLTACIDTDTPRMLSRFSGSAPLSFFVPKAGRQHPQTL